MGTSTPLAVVSGGAGGIGGAVCAALSRDGHRVVALGRDPSRLARLARPVEGRVCDVTDEAAVAAAVAEIAAHEPISVLVNSAGTAESAPLHRTTLEAWNTHFAVNATSAFLLTRAVLPAMRERDHGRVVFIASTAAHAGTPYTAAYTASKHAMLGLARTVAAEVAGTGVTSNAVCPAFVRSPMTERSVRRIAERTGRGPEDAERALAEAAPLGRLVAPDEVAAAVSYLASGAAACVNGQSLVLDGGGIQQ
ncbi:short-subunit dehydrogenase [Murinocardiopsis flavida]|uniref:Short-subunit dehydrogenase n=1 Tax=Murinocardiopsis flavida TaxID=645275 RepID=A0A2P8DST7_9ACTN|nr:SDR family oxidoreductase [Murinocardiopsis flavida]PSL00280.1 short-subunit dehydrogenase [Murinocardiopsis flavida]